MSRRFTKSDDVPSLLMDDMGRLYRVVEAEEQSNPRVYRIERVDWESDLRRTIQARFGLTNRESEIALLLGRRATNREIASELGISLHTARHHTGRVLEKARLRSRSEVHRLLRVLKTPASPG